jgi:hypothetical protein
LGGTVNAPHSNLLAHAFDLQLRTVNSVNNNRMWVIGIVIAVFIFGLFPNAAARKLETGTSMKVVEIRNDNTILKDIRAHDLDRFVHAIKLHEPAILIVIQSHARSIFVLVFVLVPALLPYLSVRQPEDRSVIVAVEFAIKLTVDVGHDSSFRLLRA